MTGPGTLGPDDPAARGRPIPTVTIPSDDLTFREHVRRIAERYPSDTPAELEARLRRLFPRVVVRPRALWAEPEAWYVYRDGAWRPPTRPWWTEPLVPHLVFGGDGWVTTANASALSLLGMNATQPRHYSDFVVQGAGDAVDTLFSLVREGNPLGATVVLRQAGGHAIACEGRAETVDGAIHVWLRLADDIAAVTLREDRVVPSLVTVPADDPLFQGYVARQLDAMPEPTPEGLSLRLHRLYPHASVQATGPDHWTARRDREDRPGSDGRWWTDTALPRVRYDDRGLILAANPAAQHLLGGELIGRHWHELVTPGSTDEVEPVLAMLRTVGEAVSRFRMPGAGGRLIEFDSHTRLDDDVFTTTMRPTEA